MSGNEYIKIYNAEGALVTEDISTGGYFDFNKGTQEIDLNVGYVIEIKYPNKYQNKIRMYSTTSGNLLPEYNANSEITRYVVINNGLIKEDMDEDIANEIAYEQLKPSLIAIIEEYKSKVTSAELNNKFINFKEKAKVVDAYMRLKEIDQIPYTSLITAIQKGGSPIITAKSENLEYKIGTTIDLYSLITATDNEDGTIIIDKTSTTIDTKLDTDIAGNYKVTYKVSDSDNNVSTKVIYIEIIDDSIPEIPDLPDEEEKPEPEEPELPEDDDTETPEEPDLPVEDDTQEPEEKPDLPVEDDSPKPEEKPSLPEEDNTQTPEEPDLPVEDNNSKPEVPVLPEKDNNQKVEIKPTLTEGNNNKSSGISENNNTNELETISDLSNQNSDNFSNNTLEEVNNQANEEIIHDKEMIHDEIDSVTGPEELPYTGSDRQIVLIIITAIFIASLICLFIRKKEREN